MWKYLLLPVPFAIWYLTRKKVEAVDLPPFDWPRYPAATMMTAGDHPGVFVL